MAKYDMIISRNLLWNMGMDILYSLEQVKLMDNFIPLKCFNTLTDQKICKMLYLMHTDTLLIKEVEECTNQILDADYIKVDILMMVARLDILDGYK